MKTSFQTRLCSVVLLFAFPLLGCQPSRKSSSETPLVKAYKLIDHQHEDDAIVILEQEISRTPDETAEKTDLQVALASAYAHKAGFRAQRLGGILALGKHKISFDQKFSTDRPGQSSVQKVDFLLNGISGLMGGVQGVMAYFNAVPEIQSKDEKYLDYSMRILDSLEYKYMTEGEAVFRAVIRAIYLKNYLAAHVFYEGPSAEYDVSTCQINFAQLTQATARTTHVGLSILEDLAFATPKKAKDFEKLRKQLVSSAADLTTVTTSVSLLDEASMLIAKRAVVESGLRNLLTCRSDEPQKQQQSAPSLSPAS